MIYYTPILDLEKAAIHCTFGTSTIQLSDKVGWTLQAPTLPMMAHWHRVRPDLMSVSISGQALEYVAMCGRGQRGQKWHHSSRRRLRRAIVSRKSMFRASVAVAVRETDPERLVCSPQCQMTLLSNDLVDFANLLDKSCLRDMSRMAP